MATPTRLNKKTYIGSLPIPTDDVGDIGGAINTGTAIVETTVGNLLADMRIGTTDQYFYTVFYEAFDNTASGSIQNARVANRAGALVNTSAGTCGYASTNALDTGVVRALGKVGGTWTTEDVTLTGTTPAFTLATFDVGTVVRHEIISGASLGAISCSVNGDIVGMIWGTDNDPTDGAPSIATYMATAEIDIAIATAINTNLTSTDRKTAPSGIGSFSKATIWTSADASIGIAIPGGALGVGDYIGVVVRFTSFGNVKPSFSGKIQFKHGVIGDATS